MKRYLIKFSQPVIVDDSTEKEKKQATIYGFLGPKMDDDEELSDYLVYDINSYVDYLAAMDERNAAGEKDFDIDKDKNRIGWSQRICELGRKRREETGLTFTLSTIDLERIDSGCLVCGIDQSVITCESLMDTLTRLAEHQAEDGKTAQCNVIIFNRPIWLPKHILWEGEEGFSHIYGLVVDEELDGKVIQDCALYLGYLAMVEEVTLTDVTPSGYTADVEKDGLYWYDRGKEYTCVSEELKKECRICRHKHNLLLRGATVTVSEKEIKQGVRDEYILSQELYEHIRALTATADYKGGCQK